MDHIFTEFVNFRSWFAQEFREKLGERYPTMKVALNVVMQRGGEHAVETGTLRSLKPDGWRGMEMPHSCLGQSCSGTEVTSGAVILT